MVVACRSAAVQRRWPSKAQTVGWHFQPKLLSTNLGDHKGPLLVRLAWAEAPRSMGPKPLLHPWFVPVARETHLPLGQASAQALRLVGRCKYAKSALRTLLFLVTEQCRNYNQLECRQIYCKTQLSTVVDSTPTTKSVTTLHFSDNWIEGFGYYTCTIGSRYISELIMLSRTTDIIRRTYI